MGLKSNSELVEYLINYGYLKTKRIINAFRNIDRKIFVPKEYEDYAYYDQPLPIGFGQTISAPHMVAIMTELLEPKCMDKVLEIGSGSGYQASILSKLVKIVYTIELESGLIEIAKRNFKKANINNVKLIHGDGSNGYQKMAPYDKIIVTCASQSIPKPLIKQLKDNGIILIPVGGHFHQELIKGKKIENNLQTKSYGGCVFVPLRH